MSSTGRQSRSNQSSVTVTDTSNVISNLYVNENAQINQILAYVGVYDPDAAENGTIGSLDLILVNARTPTVKCIEERKRKLERIKLSGTNVSLARDVESQLDELDASLLSPARVQQHNIPIKLAKIGDKLFTLQLGKKLKFNLVESYAIEMRTRDNGTRPQLESKTRINLNVLANNNFAPVFLNAQQAEIHILEGYIFFRIPSLKI